MSRAQLASAGYDSDAVAWRLATARWQAFGAAIALQDGTLAPDQRCWLAVLNAPGPAAISGRIAAVRFGLKGFAAASIDVLIAASAKPVPMAGVTWRRCRTFDAVVVGPLRRLPMVTPARALIDAAIWTAPPRIACALLAAAVQQRLVSAASLRAQLAKTRGSRHTGILRSTLADIEGGADSLSEIDFTKLARKAGIRAPIRQSVRLDSAGRRRYVDADFDRVLRFPTVAIRLDEATVVTQLRRAVAVFG